MQRLSAAPCLLNASAPLLVRATQPGWAAQQRTDEALPEACGTPSGGRLSARPGPQPPPHLRQRARGVAMATRMRTAPTPPSFPAAAPSPPAALAPPQSLTGRAGRGVAAARRCLGAPGPAQLRSTGPGGRRGAPSAHVMPGSWRAGAAHALWGRCRRGEGAR